MSSEDELKPRDDLSNRYQEVIEIQTKSIRNFDDKTWRAMRVTGIIGGIGVGALSYASNPQNSIDVFSDEPVWAAFSLSMLFFLGSFGLGIRSYKSTDFATAPTTEIGDEIQDKIADVGEYRSTVVENYVDAIERNNKTLKQKKRRFRLTLASLFLGVWTLTVGIMLGVWSPDYMYPLLVIGLLGGIVAAYLSLYCNLSGLPWNRDTEGD